MTQLMLPQPILNGTQRSYSISSLWEGTPALANLESERQLMNLVLPPWQRPPSWEEAQQMKFIESIFLGIPPGFYVINGRDYAEGGADLPMSGWLLDGQQRVTAIDRFIRDEISVFEGVFFSDLSIADKRRRFNNVIFPCIELEYQPDEDVLLELYRRLNFGGTAHTAADLALLESHRGLHGQ